MAAFLLPSSHLKMAGHGLSLLGVLAADVFQTTVLGDLAKGFLCGPGWLGASLTANALSRDPDGFFPPLRNFLS